MSANYEVPEPVLNSPYDEPQLYWEIEEGQPPEPKRGRRTAHYYYPDPNAPQSANEQGNRGQRIELVLVNLIRKRLRQWREDGYPGATRTTRELLDYWSRDGRELRLFFAQREAAETVIFLTEARSDFRQGLDIPYDEPGDDGKTKGYTAFRRYACKLATGAGKTTVMGMLAAWSILNKVNDRGDARFSDVVLVVCPNVTIRNRLRELDPNNGESSIYRTFDLVPERLMADLTKGRVLVTNWHVFEPQVMQQGGVSAKVARAGVPVRQTELIHIGPKTTTARGKRYLSLEDLNQQIGAGILNIVSGSEETDPQRNLKRVKVESVRYVGLGFAIPYLHNGEAHDYQPDYLVRLKTDPVVHLILETKGFDQLADVKEQAARRWVSAVNAEGSYGRWEYAMVRTVPQITAKVEEVARAAGPA
jgi:type III restriction enzyme